MNVNDLTLDWLIDAMITAGWRPAFDAQHNGIEKVFKKIKAQSELAKRKGDGDKQECLTCEYQDVPLHEEPCCKCTRTGDHVNWKANSPLPVAVEGEAKERPEQIVKFYKHGAYNSCFTKTINGLIAESHGVEKFEKAIGEKLKCNTCLNNEITEEEYENARCVVATPAKPEPVEPWDTLASHYLQLEQIRHKHDTYVKDADETMTKLIQRIKALEEVNELRKERAG